MVTGGQAGATATAVDLGTASSFAVLAGTTVTNTGPSAISGDLGVSPGTAVTGFPPGQVTGGTIHSADALAQSAQADATTAYNAAAAEPSSATITADLGGQSLDPGVYTGTTLGLTGTLTLDAHGDPNAVFVFQVGPDPHHRTCQRGVHSRWSHRLQRLLADQQPRPPSAPTPCSSGPSSPRHR